MNGPIFTKIVNGLNVVFNKKNGQAFIVGSSEGLGFSWQLRNSGKMRFWFEDTCSWELILKNLQELLIPCSFSTKEFKQFVENLKDSENNLLFKLEVANEIGPKHIIANLFNKACLIYHQVYFQGKYYPVLVKIDKSKGPYEIEFIGAYGPTKALQDITVRAFETVESLGRFEFILENLVETSVKSHELQRSSYRILESLEPQFEKIDSDLDKLSNEHLGQEILLTGLNQVSQNNGQVLLTLKRSVASLESKIIPGLKNEFESLYQYYDENQSINTQKFQVLANTIKNFGDNIRALGDTLVQQIKVEVDVKDEILSAVSTEHSNTQQLVIDVTNEVRNDIKDDFTTNITSAKDEIKNHVSQEILHLKNDLQQVISHEFSELRKPLKQNLYLILRAIQRIPGATTKQVIQEIKDDLGVSQRTIYNYFRRLQEKKIVNSEWINNKYPGGRSKSYYLTQKIRQLLKKHKGGSDP